MSRHGRSNHDRRANLAELDSALRSRLLGLDEPVDRSDWGAVVKRSRAFRASRYRSFAVVASAAAVLALVVTVSLARLFPGTGHPRPEAASVRLALHLGDGSGLVLYSVAKRTRFLDNSDGRVAGRPSTVAIEHSLSGGPFHVRAALVRALSTARHVIDGPLPGDEALVSFHLFTTAGLKTTAGSAVMACQYGFDRNAYCNGAVDLQNGVRLTASGTLDADVHHLSLVATDGYGRDVVTSFPRD